MVLVLVEYHTYHMCPTTMSRDSWATGPSSDSDAWPRIIIQWSNAGECAHGPFCFKLKHGWISDEFCATILQKFAVHQATLLLTKHPMSSCFLDVSSFIRLRFEGSMAPGYWFHHLKHCRMLWCNVDMQLGTEGCPCASILYTMRNVVWWILT